MRVGIRLRTQKPQLDGDFVYDLEPTNMYSEIARHIYAQAIWQTTRGQGGD